MINKNNKFDACKVKTPKHIAKLMINKLDIDFKSDFRILEPGVGNGNIYIEVIDRFLDFEPDTTKAIDALSRRFIAFDIDNKALFDLEKNLCSLVEKHGIDPSKVRWDIRKNDLLDYKTFDKIENVTHIICNPPYLAYKHIEDKNKEKLRKFSCCEKGSPNIYFAFIEYALVNFSKLEKAVFISPSSFLQGKNAKWLRKTICENTFLSEIINFEDNVFDEQVMSCISVFSSKNVGYKFFSSNSSLSNYRLIFEKNEPDCDNFCRFETAPKNQSILMGDLFDICGAIATMDDTFYRVKKAEIRNISTEYLFFEKEAKKGNKRKNFSVEMSSVKMAFTTPNAHDNKKSYFIFPYDEMGNPWNILDVKKKCPHLYRYYKLGKKSNQSLLGYGRTQNLSRILETKYVIPKAISKFVLYRSQNEVINSGVCLFLKNEYKNYSMQIEEFIHQNEEAIFSYIRQECIPYDSKYYSISISVLKKTPVVNKEEFNDKVNLHH